MDEKSFNNKQELKGHTKKKKGRNFVRFYAKYTRRATEQFPLEVGEQAIFSYFYFLVKKYIHCRFVFGFGFESRLRKIASRVQQNFRESQIGGYKCQGGGL